MNQIIGKIPKMAQDTKKQFRHAIDMVRQSGPSNKFNPVRLAELLQSKYNEDLLEAIKMIFLSYLFNRDISVYLSRIISFVPRDDGELKRLCYILLTEVAHTQSDILMLSISAIYRDIVNLHTPTKLFALKTLPQLLIQETQPLILSSLKQIVVDKNPLVRRTAATTLIKLRDLTNDLPEEDYASALEFLLKDTPQVRLGAVNAIIQLRDDPSLAFLHQRYFTMIKDLTSLNHFDLEKSIRFLHQYALHYFTHCKEELREKKGNLSPDALDLAALLDSTEKFIRLPYPAVIVATANLNLDFPVESRLKKVKLPRQQKIARTLVRFLNISSESKFIILQTMLRFAQLYPQILKEHYRAFTIIQIEKLYCKIRKLEILQLLIDDTNVQLILDELVHHTRSNQVPLAAAAVKLLGRTSQRHPKYLKRSIRVLVDLLKSGSAEVKNHVIEAFCSIMNQLVSPQLLPLLTLCLQYLDEIEDPEHKASVIRLLNREHHVIPTISAENLRKLASKFTTQHEHVKYEILFLAYAVNKFFKDRHLEGKDTVALYYEHVLTLSQFDQHLLVRDLARSLVGGLNVEIMDHIKYIREPPQLVQSESLTFPIGSLSGFVGYQMPGFMKVEQLYVSTKPTHEQRVVIQETPAAKTETSVQQETKRIEETVIAPQTPVPENPKKKKKEVDDEVKKHYSNLNQVLNDFFEEDA